MATAYENDLIDALLDDELSGYGLDEDVDEGWRDYARRFRRWWTIVSAARALGGTDPVTEQPRQREIPVLPAPEQRPGSDSRRRDRQGQGGSGNRFAADFADELVDDLSADLATDLLGEEDAFDPRPPPPGTTLLTHFAFGGSALSAAHRAALARVADAIVRQMPSSRSFNFCFFVDAEGHEDEVGDPARFGRLGTARALAAANHLAGLLRTRIARLPAASRREVRINVTSAGPARPIRSNVTAAGRAMNRRVEIRSRGGPCGLEA
jgi:outer membrane protein OmpA-like peptidoglycan-associated protein